MAGIGGDTVDQFQARINAFPERYVKHWESWIKSAPAGPDCAELLGEILRNWQACRPNEMRRDKASAGHESPFLEDLILSATTDLAAMSAFDISDKSAFSVANQARLTNLWTIFRDLAHAGKAYKGKAGAVGISKAVLLLSRGHIGPAFDKEVRDSLGLSEIDNSVHWIDALKRVNQDIRQFEKKNSTTILKAAPIRFAGIPTGRLYDMALGPRA
jgi:hypothetical protein